ncbi:hypothetical protein ALC53_08061 [Atta colombica]|uniref:Uncharacterized protein n=1 Tax=Atta colombica TaxID=520822 RepID=A0A151I2Q5_9HYME|nr:hypothetical protein ALC53_08061 [Atta colombica]
MTHRLCIRARPSTLEAGRITTTTLLPSLHSGSSSSTDRRPIGLQNLFLLGDTSLPRCHDGEAHRGPRVSLSGASPVPLRQVRNGVNAPGSHHDSLLYLTWILCAFLYFRFSFLPLLVHLCFVLRATECIQVKGVFIERYMEAQLEDRRIELK